MNLGYDKATKMSVPYVKALALVLLVSVCSIEALSTNSSRHSQASFYGATRSFHTPSSPSLHVRLAFTATHGILFIAPVSVHGTLFTASNQSHSLALVLSNGSLTTLLVDSQQQVVESIPLSIHPSPQSWLELELSISGDNLTLRLQETTISTTLTYSLNFTGELHFGGDPSSSLTSENLVGCISNVALNSQAVQFSASTEGGYNQGCCVPPRRLPPGGLGVEANSLWGEISIETREVVVDEGTNITISDMNLLIMIPSDLVSYDIGYWHHSDLVNSVVFDVVGQPSSGYFVRGNEEHISRFFYHELQSSNPLSQIVYRHGGALGTTDSAVLRASLECQDGGQSPWSQEVVLPFSIVEVNHKPYVLHQNTLSLAAGTRRPLTPYTITVVDEETTDPANIQYTVEQVVCDDCVNKRETGGEVVNHAGHKIMFFSQERINDGRVFFQHLALNDTDVTMRIMLRVQDSPIGYKPIYPKITVRTHPGKISFIPSLDSECMFLEVGHSFILNSLYLNTTTDFQDQSPEIAYDVLVAPSEGRLEVYEANRWSLISDSLASRRLVNTPSVIGYFTQKDVDDGHVRFVHTGESGNIHTLKFRLRSSLYIQPNPDGYESVCFHTVDDFLLIQPEFVIEPRTLSVHEGNSTLINPDVISVSLSEQEVLYAPVGMGVDIKIEQLQPIFVLESPPSVGEIRVRGAPILSGDSFSLDDFQSNLVYYQNNGNEVPSDSFNVQIKPTVGVPLIKQPHPSDIITITVTVSPDNDNKPTYSLHNINVTEGSYVVITKDHILVEDADLPREVLTISFRKPRSNRPEETPTGYFAYRNKFDQLITRCTMSNILNEEVVFVHLLDPSVPLSYNQALKITDGQWILRPWPVIEVHAIPHTLTVIEPDSAHCLSLDLMSNRNRTLNISDYEFTMRDPHGMDSNLVSMVNVSVGESPLYGQLVKVVNGHQYSASQFTISDLHMGRIQYHYTSEELNRLRIDTVELYFQYGHTLEGPHPFKICINPIPIPDHIHVQAATVSNDGVSVINSTHLWANDTRGDSGVDIRYQITNPPTHGSIINEDNPASVSIDSFTQADVDNGHIAYSRPLKSGRLSDSFTFQVCSRVDVCSEEKQLILNVRFVNLTIVNPGINVTEGDNYTFSISDLSVTAPPGYGLIRFYPVMRPKYGLLVLQLVPPSELIVPTRFDVEDIRIGKLMYQSNTTFEVLFDSFTVQILTYRLENPDDFITITELINIRIIPVNDHVPELVINLPDELVVSKGGSVQITSVQLSATDLDSDIDNRDLIYTTVAYSPFNAYMYLDSDPGSRAMRISTWTEQDVRDGRLFMKAEFSEVPNDVLVVRVDETLELANFDRGTSNTAVVKIKIVDILFTEVPGRNIFIVVEGGSGIIDSTYLRYTANDYNLGDEATLYEITGPPSHGHLFLNGIELESGVRFSQLQVVNGELSYTHDHSNSYKDSFQFKIGDNMGRERDKNFSLDITIDVLDDDPPEAVIFGPVLLVLRTAVFIDENIIRITDHDTIPPIAGGEDQDNNHFKIVCTIINATKAGIIQLNRFQGGWSNTKVFNNFDLQRQTVRYTSTQGALSGVIEDSFTFSISDGTNTANTTYEVNIYLLPEVVELTVSTLAIEEDQNGALESLHFIVEHFYLSQAPGTFIITSPPTKGYLRNTVTGETTVSNFTTSQLEKESILYIHNGDEDDFDEFTFFYRSDMMQGISRESESYTFEIIITPNNDQAPILDPDRELTLQLWAGETKLLEKKYLNAIDGDTNNQGLRYIILERTVDAYVAYSNNTAKAISTFTQEDVNEAKISFVHRHDPDGYIQYNVTDGEFVTTGNFSFESDPLVLFCDEEPWTPVSVSRLGTVLLSFNNVNCVTNDLVSREIFYHIHSELQYGEFLVNDERVMSFSKSAVENDTVSYRHTEEDKWESIETVRLDIETDFETSAEKILSINIDLPHQAEGRSAINTGVTVIEGHTICLNLSSLDARNVRYRAWKNAGNGRPNLNDMDIQFMLVQSPSYGSLMVNNEQTVSYFFHSDLANGSVCYKHDDSETLSDSIGFSLTVVGRGFQQRDYSFQDTFSIAITPVNDVTPVLITTQPSMELVVGFAHTLTSDVLEITDEDSSAEDIHIVISTLPKNLRILLKDVVLNVSENFTQSNVNAGHVTLKGLLLEGLSFGEFSFYFYFTDNTVPPTEPTLHQFDVTVVQHTLEIQGTKRVILRQNKQKVKITKDFLYSHTNGDNGATVYSVVTHPTVGSVYNQTTPQSNFQSLQRTSRFTQEDIDNERVWYVPNPNSREHNDSFVVTLSNKDKYVANETVSVHVLVWGEVKSDTFVDFTDALDFTDGDAENKYSFQLPSDIITLFQPDINEPIRQIDPPKYGHLELNFRTSKRAAGNEEDAFSFHYDDLHRGWVYYVWDHDQPVAASEMEDNFTLLVETTGFRPGEAFVELSIVPPFISTPPPVTDGTRVSVPVVSTRTNSEPEPESGFPVFTLVPIIGVVLVLLLIIVIIIGFCLTQQKRIRKKLHLDIATPTHRPNKVLSISPLPIRHMHQFNFEADSDNEDERSLSSGFSEDAELPPLRSPIRSPTHSHAFSYSQPYSVPSPTYTAHQPLPQMAYRPRVLGNVSITLSGRQSVMSEISVNESNHSYSHSLPRPSPLNIAVPIPVRPASQVGYSAPINSESGYNSRNHTNENSRHHSRSSVVYEEGEELAGGEFPSALEDHVITVKDHMTNGGDHVTTVHVPDAEMEVDEGQGVHELMDLNDPNVQRLFRSTHPVLKKQEYWF